MRLPAPPAVLLNLLHLPVTDFTWPNPGQPPGPRPSSREELGGAPLIRMQMRPRLAQQQNVLRQPSVSRQEERGASVAVSKVHRAALEEEEAQDIDRGGCCC